MSIRSRLAETLLWAITEQLDWRTIKNKKIIYKMASSIRGTKTSPSQTRLLLTCLAEVHRFAGLSIDEIKRCRCPAPLAILKLSQFLFDFFLHLLSDLHLFLAVLDRVPSHQHKRTYTGRGDHQPNSERMEKGDCQLGNVWESMELVCNDPAVIANH